MSGRRENFPKWSSTCAQVLIMQWNVVVAQAHVIPIIVVCMYTCRYITYTRYIYQTELKIKMACFVPTYRPFRPARIFQTSVRWPLHGATLYRWRSSTSGDTHRERKALLVVSRCQLLPKCVGLILHPKFCGFCIVLKYVHYIITAANTAVAGLFPTSRIGSHSEYNHDTWKVESTLGLAVSFGCFQEVKSSVLHLQPFVGPRHKGLIIAWQEATWESGC